MEKRTLKLGKKEVTPIEHNIIVNGITGVFNMAAMNKLKPFVNYVAEMYPRLCFINEEGQHRYYKPDIAIFKRSQTIRSGKLIAIIEVENKEKKERAKAKAPIYFSEDINVLEYFIYLYDENSWERIRVNPENEELESSETDRSPIMKIELSDLFLNMAEFAKKYEKIK